MDKLPKTVTGTYYAHINKYDMDTITLFNYDMSDHGYICLGPVEITFDVPQIDVMAAQMSSLEKVKEKLVTEYETKLKQVDEQIQNLRALTFSPEYA